MKSKRIRLPDGKCAIVDAEDYERISQYKWHYNCGAAHRIHIFHELPLKAEKVRIAMSNAVLQLPMDIEVDHINHRQLDNRKSNLRQCTRRQNCYNRQPSKYRKMTSKYKGVFWLKTLKKWRAAIVNEGKFIHLGLFCTERKAARAYDKKAKEIAGEFAYLNFR